MKKKVYIAVPSYKSRKHTSAQAMSAQRMPARVYENKKKKMEKEGCRGNRSLISYFYNGMKEVDYLLLVK